MRFETVFDVAEAGYKSWWFPASGLIFLALGAAILLFPKWVRLVFSGPTSRASGWTLIIFASAWTLCAFIPTYYEYILARNALLSGDHRVVEGPVTDFIPMRSDGKGGPESFSVAGQKFSYSDYSIMPGFNNTRSHGGPIDSGFYVRVTYHRTDTILRLEIRR